jgi:transcriptional regulator GlxA family with amidase domain
MRNRSAARVPRKAVSRARARRTVPQRRSDRVLDVTVLLLDGGYPSTAIGPIEVFHSAGLLWNRLHGNATEPRFRVRVASIDGGSVTSLCSLQLTPEFGITDIMHTDIIILPASGLDLQDRIARSTGLLAWLRKWHARGAYIAGICSGVAFLAECGLLDGRLATTHWAVADALHQRYPQVCWRPDRFVTEDERVLCSGGVYASIDLSLYLVEKFCGHEIALQCAKSLLVSMPRTRQSGYAVLALSRPHADDTVRRAEKHLQQHFQRGVTIDALADLTGMSPRNFIRRFKAATGLLPGAYLQALRMSAAKELLEQSSTPIQSVCTRVGYEDMAFFRALFKRHTGMTPAEYRNRFAKMSFDRGELASGSADP